MNVSNRVAIVTGSGQGIGKEIALMLAKYGATLVISDVNPATAQETAAEIQTKNGRSIAIAANVTAAAEVAKLVEQTIATFGHIDILVNNAGITRDGLLMRMSESEWDEVLETDLRSAFLCTRAALRPMVRQHWGRIISVGSVAGMVGNAGRTNYAAAKAGLIGFTKALAKEVASRGI